ncbi:hypothetical protein Dimus_022084 [Dionaea muscipula]
MLLLKFPLLDHLCLNLLATISLFLVIVESYGATHHVCNDISIFHTTALVHNDQVTLQNGAQVQIAQIGSDQHGKMIGKDSRNGHLYCLSTSTFSSSSSFSVSSLSCAPQPVSLKSVLHVMAIHVMADYAIHVMAD